MQIEVKLLCHFCFLKHNILIELRSDTLMVRIFKIQPNPSATPHMTHSLDPSPGLLPFSLFPCEVRGPELDKRLERWPHKCQVQGHNHLPAWSCWPSIADTGQDTNGLLGHRGTCWIMFSQLSTSTPRCFSSRQPLLP